MNPNVGKQVNGWTLLDGPTFERVVVQGMIDGLGDFSQGIGPGCVLIAPPGPFPGLPTGPQATFTANGFDYGPFTTYTPGNPENAEGGNAPADVATIDYSAARPAFAAWLRDPKRVFLWDGEQGTGSGRDRIKVAYVRYPKGQSIVCAKASPYSNAGEWVSVRSIIVFVGSVVFSVVGAPVLSAAASDAAAGVEIGTTAASTGGAQLAGVVASNDAALIGSDKLSAAVGIGNLVVSAGSTLSGAIGSSGPAVSQGASAMDDFGIDSFNFSSGESPVAYSDAQNVDFGLGESVFDFGSDTSDFGGQLDGFGDQATDAFGQQTYNFGATPEVTTNDFGTTWDDQFGANSAGTGVKAVALAGQAAGVLSKPSKGTVASSGPNGSKASNFGLGADILAGIGSVYRTAAGVAQGVAGQATTAQRQTYAGQLTPSGGLPTGSSNAILIAGGALVALALFLHMKG